MIAVHQAARLVHAEHDQLVAEVFADEKLLQMLSMSFMLFVISIYLDHSAKNIIP